MERSQQRIFQKGISVKMHSCLCCLKTHIPLQGWLLSTLKSMLDYFVKDLRIQFDKCEGVTRCNACWKAFQLELPLEELSFRHLLSTADHQFSVSLGTNNVNSKSMTDTWGLIGLAPYSAASAVEEPQPGCFLCARTSVTGFALIMLLLCDTFWFPLVCFFLIHHQESWQGH